MIVLGLDTTGPECSVSLVDEAVVLAHISERIGRGHAEVLAGMVERVIDAAGLSPTDIDRLAVCTGPGNFTGLRVALSFAIGFALPRDLPVIGVNALDITALDVTFTDNETAMAIYRDVRRDEVFYCEYKNGRPVGSPCLMSFEKSVSKASEKSLLSVESISVDTRVLAWLAIDLDPADYPPVPLYARGPDAKLPGGKTLPQSAA